MGREASEIRGNRKKEFKITVEQNDQILAARLWNSKKDPSPVGKRKIFCPPLSKPNARSMKPNGWDLEKMAKDWGQTDESVMDNPFGGIKPGWEEIR